MRGICALLIVWHHFAPTAGIPYSYDFGNTIVLFFFVLSGYGITLSWKDRIAGNTKVFLTNRCVKIFPIQWFTVILYILFGINILSWWAVPFHLTLTQSAIPLWEINFTMNTPSWFLSSLFFCYLCTPFLLRYATLHKRTFVVLQVCAIACFVVLIYILSGKFGTRWLSYINPSARLLDYSVGMTLGLFWSRLEKAIYNCGERIYTLLEVVFLSLAIMFMIDSALFEYNKYAALRYPIVIGLVAVFSVGKGYVSQFLKNRWLEWLGEISMSIYMTHGVVLFFAIKIDMPTWLNIILTYTLIIAFSHVVDKGLLHSSRYFYAMANKIFHIRRILS